LVNAAGAWVEEVVETVLREPPPRRLRLDKGSHIVVRRLYDHDRAYILQTADRRVVFTIPFQRDYTLIGTTDRSFAGDPGTVAPSQAEIDYLCGVVNDYFRASIAAADVVWAYAGVRALYDDGAKKPQDIDRDYALLLDKNYREAPLLTVYGGKLTTFRRLAEDVLDRLSHFLPRSRPWTAKAPLPGGDFVFDGLPAIIARIRRQWPFFGEDHAQRLAHAYGSRVADVLGTAARLEDLGTDFGEGLTAAEVRYLMRHEWAQTADDVLWRRSKLGLRFSDAQKVALEAFMTQAK
jgi:glycerol-3-phosphate dehydrogenase